MKVSDEELERLSAKALIAIIRRLEARIEALELETYCQSSVSANQLPAMIRRRTFLNHKLLILHQRVIRLLPTLMFACCFLAGCESRTKVSRDIEHNLAVVAVSVLKGDSESSDSNLGDRIKSLAREHPSLGKCPITGGAIMYNPKSTFWKGTSSNDDFPILLVKDPTSGRYYGIWSNGQPYDKDIAGNVPLSEYINISESP